MNRPPRDWKQIAMLAGFALCVLFLLGVAFAFFMIYIGAGSDLEEERGPLATILIAALLFAGSIIAWLRRPPGGLG